DGGHIDEPPCRLLGPAGRQEAARELTYVGIEPSVLGCPPPCFVEVGQHDVVSPQEAMGASHVDEVVRGPFGGKLRWWSPARRRSEGLVGVLRFQGQGYAVDAHRGRSERCSGVDGLSGVPRRGGGRPVGAGYPWPRTRRLACAAPHRLPRIGSRRG